MAGSTRVALQLDSKLVPQAPLPISKKGSEILENNATDIDLDVAVKDNATMNYNRSLSKTHTYALKQTYTHISMFS